jgi:hypothetical protein
VFFSLPYFFLPNQTQPRCPVIVPSSRNDDRPFKTINYAKIQKSTVVMKKMQGQEPHQINKEKKKQLHPLKILSLQILQRLISAPYKL